MTNATQPHNIIHFTTGNGEFVAVDVPRGAYDFYIYNIRHTVVLDFLIETIDKDEDDIGYISLPPDYTYTPIGIAGELTNMDCIGIVDKVSIGIEGIIAGYPDYVTSATLNNALSSFESLLKLHSIAPTSFIAKREFNNH